MPCRPNPAPFQSLERELGRARHDRAAAAAREQASYRESEGLELLSELGKRKRKAKAPKRDGERLEAQLREVLDFHMRSEGQRLMHEGMTEASARVIYRDTWGENELEFKRRRGIEFVNPFLMVVTPRRYGKTYGVAQYCAACLFVLPGITITVLSPSQAQSYMLRAEISKIFDQICDEFEGRPGFRRVTRRPANNKSEIRVRFDDGTESEVAAVPLTETARGRKGDLVIFEEAALFNHKDLMAIGLPILQTTDSACIAISTRRDSENYMNKLMETPDSDTGRTVFNVLAFSLSCDECTAKGLVEECVHNRDKLPPWLSEKKLKRVRDIMNHLGGGDAADRELAGVATQSGERVYEASDVQRTIAQPPFYARDVTGEVTELFVAVDPNAGGARSDFAVCSGFLNFGALVVTGIETVTSRVPREQRIRSVLEHARAVRQASPLLGNARIVFLIESNSQGAARDTILDIQDHGTEVLGTDNWVIASKSNAIDRRTRRIGDLNNAGFWTNEEKDVMRKKLTALMKRGWLRFFKPFTSVHYRDDRDATAAAGYDAYIGMRKKLARQLANFEWIVDVPQSEFQAAKRTMSGKSHGPDDAAMSLMLLAYWSWMCMEHPGYVQAGAPSGSYTVHTR